MSVMLCEQKNSCEIRIIILQTIIQNFSFEKIEEINLVEAGKMNNFLGYCNKTIMNALHSINM